MPLFFTIDDRNRFNVEVMKDTDTAGLNLSSIIRKVTKSAKGIKTVYLEIMTRDNRISGQDRVKLLEEIDGLLRELLLLYDRMDEKISKKSKHKGGMIRVSVRSKINKYEIKGMLDDRSLRKIKDFDKSYDVMVLREIKNLLLYCSDLYSEKAGDREMAVLYKKFDSMFFTIITLRYGIENLFIDK